MNVGKKKMKKRILRKRTCRFCKDGVKDIDYKDLEIIRRYVTERGKIRARRTTGSCAKHQRQLSAAIKRARILGQIPFRLEYHRH
ncbi:MAG TPA: 30S ribosomal protein S18 [bacterium]|nr:30S ribosomal protein S18 [bacterium]